MSTPDAADVPSVSPRELYDRIRAPEPITPLGLRDSDEVEAWRIGGDSVSLTQLPYYRFM